MTATIKMTPVDALMHRLGPCVLLRIPRGKKGPITPDWQKLMLSDMTPEYLASFNGDNIGVSLGNASAGLCTIDADSDDGFEKLLGINPHLSATLKSKGQRGGNLWIRVHGEFPPSCKLKTSSGESWGEWRGDRCQTVIHGTHPSGCSYSHNEQRPLEVTFTEINWPHGLILPWRPENKVPHKPKGTEEFFIIPSGNLSISDSAKGIFSYIAQTHTLFIRAGGIVEACPGDDGFLSLRTVTPAGFCSRIEGYGRSVAAWRVGDHGEFVLKIARCSVDNATVLLASLEAEECLPRIRTISAAPILLERKSGEIIVLGQGYYPENGGTLVAGGDMPENVDLARAREALLELLADFDLPTPGDHARAIASMISPCLKFGWMLGSADFPLDVAEATVSQSGKTYRQKLVAAIYGERAHVINMRNGGVGSLDESISAAMLSGRPFISIDNMRGRVDSQILESALRGHGRVDVRAVRKAPVQISTDSFLWQLSSNGADMTRDLANRSIVVRVRKRPSGFRFKKWPEGALVEHVLANQPYYLGCIFAIVEQWLARGKPKTDESRHDFREWVQSLDWICQELIGTVPILDGHQDEQERIGNPNLVWLREVSLAVKGEGEDDGREIPASRIAEICSTGTILFPGGKSEPDDHKATLHVGRLMAKLFSENDEIFTDSFSIRRITRAEQDKDYRIRPVHRYVFKEASV